METIVVTGAAGFLGAHLLLEHFVRTNGHAVAIVRADDDLHARRRVAAALMAAVDTAGVDPQVATDALDALDVRNLDVTDSARVRETFASLHLDYPGGLRVVHTAANLSFRQQDLADLVRTNIDGTANVLAALRPEGVESFNHVSTAYVAGMLDGTVPESLHLFAGQRFHNPYEQTKCLSEAVIADWAESTGVRTRVLRPSIVVGHSRTHRSESDTGLYKVIESMAALADITPPDVVIPVPVVPGACVDLVHVDSVVAELLDLVGTTGDQGLTVHHLTSTNPTSVEHIVATGAELAGVRLELCPPGLDNDDPLLDMVRRSIRHYLPYLGLTRSFVRTRSGGERYPQVGDAAIEAMLRTSLADRPSSVRQSEVVGASA